MPYAYKQHTTKAHGTFWTLVTPDGLPFGLRYFSEEHAARALAQYLAAMRNPGPESLARTLDPKERS